MTPSAHRACAEDILAIEREIGHVARLHPGWTVHITRHFDRLRERLAAETPVAEDVMNQPHDATARVEYERRHKDDEKMLAAIRDRLAATKPRCPSIQDGCDSLDVCRADGECHYTKTALAPRNEKALTETLIMDLWREAGLPEYFLGNSDTNHGLVRFVKLAIASAKATP